MDTRKLIVMVIVTVTVMGVPGGASASSGHGGSGAERRPSEMAALLAGSLQRLDAPAELVAAAEDEDLDRALPYLRVVNDLDGDGLRDIVSIGYAPASPGDTGELVLTARRGLDGTVLFTHRRAGTGWGAFVPARVGGGQEGLLLVRYSGVAVLTGAPGAEDPHGFTNYGVDVAVDIVAIDGTGQQLWQRTFGPGHYAYPRQDVSSEQISSGVAIARDVPVVGGLLSGATTDDLLVSMYDRTHAPSGKQGSLRTVVLNGSDGSDRSQATLDITDALTTVAPAGDLTGDGADDYAVLLEGQAENAGTTLRTFRAADGTAISSTALARRQALFTGIRPVGDMTGDGARELVLSTYPWYPSSYPADETVAVLDGRGGQLLHQRQADGAVDLGDITGDGRTELGLWADVSTSQVVGARYTAVRATGSPVYEVEHVVARASSGTPPSVTPAGDVNADGVVDLAHDTVFGSPPAAARIVSGRDGSLLREGPLGGRPAGTTISGQGADFVGATDWGRAVRDVTAVNGRTGAGIWSHRLRARGREAGSPDLAVADLDGDGRGEVIVTLPSGETQVEVPSAASVLPESYHDGYVLSGRDGSVLWQTDPDPVLETADVAAEVEPAKRFEWEGGTTAGFTWSPVQSGDCAADNMTQPCERLLVRMTNPPAAHEAGRTATGVVELSDFAPAPAPVTDFDLYVFESDQYGTRGRELGRSENGFDEGDELVSFPLTTTAAQPSRFVLIEVAAYQNPGASGYKGSVRLDP